MIAKTGYYMMWRSAKPAQQINDNCDERLKKENKTDGFNHVLHPDPQDM